MMYSNIIVIKNYDILHTISIIMRLCMIKHPGTTTTNERLPAQQKERLPRNRNSTVYRGCMWGFLNKLSKGVRPGTLSIVRLFTHIVG